MKMKMKQFATLLVIILLMAPAASIGQSKGNNKKNQKNSKGQIIELFNGKDLNNWVFQLKDPAVDAKTVFTVQKRSHSYLR